MKMIFFALATFLSAVKINAQATVSKDSSALSRNINVFMDSRLELLARKEAEINEAIASGPKMAKGFRLMVLSTTDRKLAMNVRGRLLQLFPEQKIYMSFQPPHIKVKLGNFLERTEAEQYKKEIILSKLVTTEIYLLPEIVEIKTEKNKESL